MGNMDDSIPQDAGDAGARVEAPWKSWAGTVCALLLALIFLTSGFWKLTDPLSTAQRMIQMLFPAQLALAVAIVTGLAEAWAGVMVVVPRWRKWGAWLSGLLLLAFMVYMAVNYKALTGADCSCFPWVKRVVGPMFFLSDGAMLALAVGAAVWSRKVESGRQALMALGALVVFAGAVLGVTMSRQTGLRAPDSVLVDGKAYDLQQGRVYVFFFDPECMHCFDAAQRMEKFQWNNVRTVVLPTKNPQWGAPFLRDTGLHAPLSKDTAKMRAVFQFTDPPYAVALENGRQLKALTIFDEKHPEEELKALGWLK